MKIRIESKGLEEAIKFLDKKTLAKEDIDLLLDRIAEIGVNKAQSGFNSSILKDAKGNLKTPEVDVKFTRSGYTRNIIASGTDAVYSEFGVGILNTYTHQLDSVVAGIDPLGHHIVSKRPSLDWLHKQGRSLGDITDWAIEHGSVPSEAMYKAAKEMEQRVPEIIREVIK